MDQEKRIQELEDELEDIKSKLLDLSFQVNYSKERELLEFVRDLYTSLKDSEANKDLSSEDLIKNLKTYIEEFARNNRLML